MSATDIDDPILQLLPAGGLDHAGRPLRGLYLNAELPVSGRSGPWVYSNFVSTLDGRISVKDEASGIEGVPPAIADPRDWRLFQELACRADVLLTSGRYLRDLKAGQAQDILPLASGPGFADLHQWRARHAMTAQPDVAILSASLDFSIPPLFAEQGRQLTVLTTDGAPVEGAERLRAAGVRVMRVGGGNRVCGKAAVAGLNGLGYRRIYSVTGPYVFHSLAEADVLDTLFLTWRHRIIGGTGSTFNSGPTLIPPVDMQLQSLYQDLAPGSAGQCFARFDRA